MYSLSLQTCARWCVGALTVILLLLAAPQMSVAATRSFDPTVLKQTLDCLTNGASDQACQDLTGNLGSGSGA